jgi:hypothetical protein
MKKVLTLIFGLTCIWTIQAQSFVFVKDGVELPNNAAIEVSEVNTRPLLEIQSGLELINKTDQTLDIIVSQTVLTPPYGLGAILSLCFFECMVTNNNISIQGELPVNYTSDIQRFVAEFYPAKDIYETVIVKYEVENANNPSDKIAVTVTYKYTDGTDIKTPKSGRTLNIYQKGNEILFNVQTASKENLRLTVYDLTGQTKVAQIIPDAAQTAVITNLEKGVYLVSLSDGNTIIFTQKFIVQ